MIVELRSVPDCPNLPATRDLLLACLAEAGLAEAVVVERVGEFPSPSVLVDGVDVTGAPVDGPAACVLRPPTTGQIRAALANSGAARPSRATGALPDAAECCLPGDPIRTDRPVRAAGLTAPVRQVHQRLLRHIAATGRIPGAGEMAAFAVDAEVDAADAVVELAALDLVAVDGDGRIEAAYPFSPTPTPHMVAVGGVEVFAMCAIDALGLPYMLEADAVITSTDPHDATPITVTITGGRAVFDPAGAVVVYAATAAGGRSVDSCCATINFFTDRANADVWIAARPGLAATVLDQAAAVTLGRDIFGPLLTGA